MSTSPKPDKVVIECTAEGYSVTVKSGDAELWKAEHRMVTAGHSESVAPPPDLWDTFPAFEEFAHAIDDVDSFQIFEVSSALFDIHEKESQP